MNDLKRSWSIICHAFHEDRLALLLAVLVALGCAALMVLTIKTVGKFAFLTPFFLILIAILLFNFYVDVAIFTIKLFK